MAGTFRAGTFRAITHRVVGKQSQGRDLIPGKELKTVRLEWLQLNEKDVVLPKEDTVAKVLGNLEVFLNTNGWQLDQK
jgi:hypothetical protein